MEETIRQRETKRKIAIKTKVHNAEKEMLRNKENQLKGKGGRRESDLPTLGCKGRFHREVHLESDWLAGGNIPIHTCPGPDTHKYRHTHTVMGQALRIYTNPPMTG